MSGCSARIAAAARSPSSVCLGRHPDVGDHDVGLLACATYGKQGVRVADGGDDLVAGAIEDADQTLAQQRDVLGQDDPQSSAGTGTPSSPRSDHRVGW